MTHMVTGGLTVPVTIDGSNRNFVLVPIATYSGLFKDVASELDLREEHLDSEHLYSGEGHPIDHYVVASSLAVGAVAATHVRLLVLSRDTATPAFAGYLGADFFKNFDVDFDFGSMTLNLFSPDHCAGKVVYWARDYVELPFKPAYGGLVRVEVTLDGHSLLAQLNPSDDPSYLDSRTATQLYGLDDRSPGAVPLKGAAPDGPAQFGYRFKLLSMEGVSVSNPLIALLHNHAEAAYERDEGKAASAIYGNTLDIVPLSIGYGILGKLHLYLAYGEQKIYLTAANAGAGPASPAH